ncbi:hypothetical protein M5E88_04980 [Akkermansia muciniphila]|nr:hypothetical protein M5E88_04980 [Akkermansia muciniphila]
MERLSFASLTLSAMTSHKRLKLRQCTNCECVINGVWEWVEECARAAAEEEPAMRGILDDVCLSRNSLATSISARLARKLSRRDMPRELIEPLIREALAEDQNILSQIAQDLIAIVDRDPACRTPLEPLLFTRGSTPSPRTASPTGCGSMTGRSWPFSSRAWPVKYSRWTSIRRPPSAAASCWTTPPVSW